MINRLSSTTLSNITHNGPLNLFRVLRQIVHKLFLPLFFPSSFLISLTSFSHPQDLFLLLSKCFFMTLISLPLGFLAQALYVFDIPCNCFQFRLFLFLSSFQFGLMLELLVPVFPAYCFNVNIQPFEVFSKGPTISFFNLREMNKKERVTNLSNVEFFEAENMAQLVLFVRSHKRNKPSPCFFDQVPVLFQYIHNSFDYLT